MHPVWRLLVRLAVAACRGGYLPAAVVSARQQHFAHPPGMVPPGVRHSPESLWHAESKQAVREWAEEQGFTARAEARTPDGRRRSDVEVVMPDGHRLAIERRARQARRARRSPAPSGAPETTSEVIMTTAPRTIPAHWTACWRAACHVVAGLPDLHREQVHAWECICRASRAPVDRPGPLI
jgi:hypothetical protein